MKINITISILFLIISSIQIFGQNKIVGEFYSPVRNKFLKIIIKEDSIILTKQKFDLTEKSNYSNEGLFKIQKIINNENKVSFIVSETIFIDKSDLHRDSMVETREKEEIKVITFRLDTINMRVKLAIFSLDDNYKNILLAEQFIKELPDTFKVINLYNQQSIAIEIGKKEVKLMSLDELKSYLNKVILFDKENKNIRQEKYKLNYVYSESVSREILSKLGFNSFFKGSELDAIFEKYSDDKEVKKIMSRILNKSE